MFFFLSKFFFFLTQPLNWSIGLAIYALFSKVAKRKRIAFRLSLGILFVISNPLIGNFVARFYETPATPMTEVGVYEYCVVLGGFTNMNTDYNADRLNLGYSPNRLVQAIELYKAGKIKKIVLTGGSATIIGSKDNEALVTDRFLRLLGVPQSDYIIEKEARNTYENFYYTKKLIRNDKTKSLVITSAFHVPRSRLIARKAGLKCDFFATDFFREKWSWSPYATLVPNDKYIMMWNFMMKEWIGVLVYKIRGYA